MESRNTGAKTVKSRVERSRVRTAIQSSWTNGTEPRKEEILSAYEERSSLRGLERTFSVARSTVSRWLKKNEENTGEG